MLTTLSYQARLAQKQRCLSTWPPITAEEIAKEAIFIRCSNMFIGEERQQWVAQSFCTYTIREQCMEPAQGLELSPDPNFQREYWIMVFQDTNPLHFNSWWRWLEGYSQMKVFFHSL